MYLICHGKGSNCKVTGYVYKFDEFTSTITVTGQPVIIGGVLKFGKGASWDLSAGFIYPVISY